MTVVTGGTSNGGRPWLFWLVLGAAFVYALFILQTVLLPFVMGAAVAYFLDPIADALERRGVSRTMATVFITASFALIIVNLVLVLLPILEVQVNSFITHVPGYANSVGGRVGPVMAWVQAHLPPDQVASIKSEAAGLVGKVGTWALDVARGVLSSGLQIIDLMSLVVLTPVVSFYLLRDWDVIIARLDSWLPRAYAHDIREQAKRIDTTLAGFARGQATVCLILAVLYGGGLTLVGLDLGLVVGLGAGIFTFIPFVGTFGGLLVSVVLAFAQFGDLTHVGFAAGVFIIGHLLESNFLSPTLVGERVGLHPVWIIFAVLAGAALAGFVGVLLAVPVAAVLGVLCRYFIDRYLHSRYFSGSEPAQETLPAAPVADHDHP